MWRSCGEVTQPPVPRLPKLWRDFSGSLWRGYQICGEITCGEVTLWRGYSHPNTHPGIHVIKTVHLRPIHSIYIPSILTEYWLNLYSAGIDFSRQNCRGLTSYPSLDKRKFRPIGPTAYSLD